MQDKDPKARIPRQQSSIDGADTGDPRHKTRIKAHNGIHTYLLRRKSSDSTTVLDKMHEGESGGEKQMGRNIRGLVLKYM